MLYFTGYDSMTVITADLFNQTTLGSNSIRLDSSANETKSIGKSLLVKPGDVIDMTERYWYLLPHRNGITTFTPVS